MTAHVPAATLTWTSVVPMLQGVGENQSRRIYRSQIGHPLGEGFEQRGAASDGSHCDYELCIAENTWLLVREYTEGYDAKLVRQAPAPVTLVVEQESALAQSRPVSSSLANLPADAPGLTIGLGTALGAVGGMVAGGGKGAAVGALIGCGAALAAVAVSTAASSPETSQVAHHMFDRLASAGLGGSTGRQVIQKPTPARRTSSRAADFDRADFAARYRKTTGKK